MAVGDTPPTAVNSAALAAMKAKREGAKQSDASSKEESSIQARLNTLITKAKARELEISTKTTKEYAASIKEFSKAVKTLSRYVSELTVSPASRFLTSAYKSEISGFSSRLAGYQQGEQLGRAIARGMRELAAGGGAAISARGAAFGTSMAAISAGAARAQQAGAAFGVGATAISGGITQTQRAMALAERRGEILGPGFAMIGRGRASTPIEGLFPRRHGNGFMMIDEAHGGFIGAGLPGPPSSGPPTAAGGGGGMAGGPGNPVGPYMGGAMGQPMWGWRRYRVFTNGNVNVSGPPWPPSRVNTGGGGGGDEEGVLPGIAGAVIRGGRLAYRGYRFANESLFPALGPKEGVGRLARTLGIPLESAARMLGKGGLDLNRNLMALGFSDIGEAANAMADIGTPNAGSAFTGAVGLSQGSYTGNLGMGSWTNLFSRTAAMGLTTTSGSYDRFTKELGDTFNKGFKDNLPPKELYNNIVNLLQVIASNGGITSTREIQNMALKNAGNANPLMRSGMMEAGAFTALQGQAGNILSNPLAYSLFLATERRTIGTLSPTGSQMQTMFNKLGIGYKLTSAQKSFITSNRNMPFMNLAMLSKEGLGPDDLEKLLMFGSYKTLRGASALDKNQAAGWMMYLLGGASDYFINKAVPGPGLRMGKGMPATLGIGMEGVPGMGTLHSKYSLIAGPGSPAYAAELSKKFGALASLPSVTVPLGDLGTLRTTVAEYNNIPIVAANSELKVFRSSLETVNDKVLDFAGSLGNAADFIYALFGLGPLGGAPSTPTRSPSTKAPPASPSHVGGASASPKITPLPSMGSAPPYSPPSRGLGVPAAGAPGFGSAPPGSTPPTP